MTDRTSGSVRRRTRAGEALARIRARFTGAYTDYVIVVSDFVRARDVERLHLSPLKLRTVHNGIDVAIAKRDRPSPMSPEPVVAFAGQLIPEKGAATLVRACVALLREREQPFRLRIAGTGPAEPGLRRYVAEHGLADRIEFLGQIASVPELFLAADIAVAPSEWDEAFGFTVIEAMAAGTCLLASDAGAIPEIVGRDGDAGLLFRRGDTADLALKLRALLTDADWRQRMGRAARRRVAERFTLEQMVAGYVAVFDEIDRRA
jgi:glycosyltransferase involved in cell wall biosynthesis